MSFRTFTIQTNFGVDTTRSLMSDVEIAFTVSAMRSNSATSRKSPLVAWKVLQFSAGVADVKQVRLYSSRRVGVAEIQYEGASQFVAVSDSGAGLGPNQHLSISSSGRWSSHILFEMAPDSSFITNNASRKLVLSIGSRSPTTPFEPMTLLPELRHEDGVQGQYPYMVQAYDVTGTDCAPGKILQNPGLGLLKNAAGQPTPLDVRTLLDDAVFHLHSDPTDGTSAVLERIVRPRKVPIPRPPPLPQVLIPSTPLFVGPIRSPVPRLAPRLPAMPLSPGSPGFNWAYYTPPHTPMVPLPSPPLSPGSPGFLSPLLTPRPESGMNFFMSAAQ